MKPDGFILVCMGMKIAGFFEEMIRRILVADSPFLQSIFPSGMFCSGDKL
jgi:hypothetical protein